MEILPEFRKANDALEGIKLNVVKKCKIDYKSQDARMVALDSIQICISATGMWIQCCNSLANANTSNGKFNQDSFLKSVGSGVNIEQTEKIMFDNLKLGFMTLTHFKIDNLFHNILKHLGELPKKAGYWNLTDTILEQTSYSRAGTEKDILSAFANLRNSLHRNGMHTKSNLTVKIGKYDFKFIKGSRVECASWAHIIVLLQENIKVLEKILLSKKILDIKTEIIDDFAFGN